jgi:hypothetical protein
MKTRAFSVLALLAVLLVAPLAPARASDAYERYTEWYSDATKTEVVGWRQEHCGGTADADGYQTSYSQSWNGDRCIDGGGGGGYYVCYLGWWDPHVCPAQCYACYYV